MAKKLYGNNIRKACEVCQHGRLSADGSVMMVPTSVVSVACVRS